MTRQTRLLKKRLDLVIGGLTCRGGDDLKLAPKSPYADTRPDKKLPWEPTSAIAPHAITSASRCQDRVRILSGAEFSVEQTTAVP